MRKKILLIILFLISFQIIKAQDGQEFITIWKPNISNITPAITINAPTPAGPNQIWFPGIGENYTISWAEVNYPQHNGVMTNVTSVKQVLIDFGTPLNPNASDATYKVKVSNGNGIFRQIRFGNSQAIVLPDNIILTWDIYGSSDQLMEIAQWGNIAWTSMNSAFTHCRRVQLTATDVPDLNNVTDVSLMFYNAYSFLGAPSMTSWDTSKIKNFSWMFAYMNDFGGLDQFNFPLGTWNTSSGEDFSYMFFGRKFFNQNLNNWNTAKATDMKWMFSSCLSYNQPMDKWDVSKVTNISFMFHFIPVFNQNLNGWDTSNVTNMAHIFHGCTAFNQPLNNWDTSKVTDMDLTFCGATSFNQSLENWNLPALTQAGAVLSNSGLDCTNYSKTIWGWATNPNTANNISAASLSPLQYAVDVVNYRTMLMAKGWDLTGDTLGTCRVTLGTSEHSLSNNVPSIYPNPAEDEIHLNHIHNSKNYKILDTSGRIIKQGLMTDDIITVDSLTKGNYILQITTKDKTQSFKFIKK